MPLLEPSPLKLTMPILGGSGGNRPDKRDQFIPVRKSDLLHALTEVLGQGKV